MPQPGEALVSPHALLSLGLDLPLGSIEATDGSMHAIVGAFTAKSPFDDFGNGVIIATDGSAAPSTLRILMKTAKDVPNVQALALDLIQPPDPSSLRVESPTALADLQNTIGRDLGSSNRGLLLLILIAGMSLTILITVADVLMRRSDLGRRRALGATRLDVIQLVVLRTVYPALAGTILGALIGHFGAIRAGAEVPLPFTGGTAVLALLASLLAALGPAFFAANRDPVRELRTP